MASSASSHRAPRAPDHMMMSITVLMKPTPMHCPLPTHHQQPRLPAALQFQIHHNLPPTLTAAGNTSTHATTSTNPAPRPPFPLRPPHSHFPSLSCPIPIPGPRASSHPQFPPSPPAHLTSNLFPPGPRRINLALQAHPLPTPTRSVPAPGNHFHTNHPPVTTVPPGRRGLL